MRFSIVIPTYEMSSYVAQTLHSLASLNVPPEHSLEVIVVDDGSTDDTRMVVGGCPAVSGELIQYVFRSRDANSSRSCARNMGLQCSTGDIVLFVDAGVILERNYIEMLAAEIALWPQTVFVCEVVGLFAHTRVSDPQEYGRGDVNEVLSQADHLRDDTAWRDSRAPLFDLVSDDLDRLPAGWSLGWTCALAMPRALALAVNGFDEAFRGWGAEDSDLCLRLGSVDAKFRAFRKSIAVHLPHPTRTKAEKEEECIVNRRLMHRRFFSLETELCLLLLPIRDSIFLRRLEGLVLEYMLPDIDPTLVARTRHRLSDSRSTLLVGPRSPNEVRALGASIAAVHNAAHAKRLAERLPEVEVLRSLGCETRFSSGDLDSVVLNDTVRLLPQELQVAQFREAFRVGKQVFVILSSRGASEDESWREQCRAVDGWRWSSSEELRTMALHCGLDLIELEANSAGQIFALRAQSTAPLRMLQTSVESESVVCARRA